MRILVAVDDSEFSADVLDAVIAQFPAQNTEVRVIHVLQPIAAAPPPQMAPGYAPELEGAKQQAHKLVDECARELSKAGFRVEARVEVGDIREEIIDAAAEWPADLIVLGSHGHGNVRRLLMGSVAESVARHAKCSVEIVRKPVH
jgi:nucleotide-binding universal stress UspA family protein